MAAAAHVASFVAPYTQRYPLATLTIDVMSFESAEAGLVAVSTSDDFGGKRKRH